MDGTNKQTNKQNKNMMTCRVAAQLKITIKYFSTNRNVLQVDYSDNPSAVRIARALWWYYISKLIELCGGCCLVISTVLK